VDLVVEDCGCKGTLEVDSAVYIKPVIAYYAGNFIGCDTPFTTNFGNISLGGNLWHWDFGTGNPADTSNAFAPSFTYNQTGNFPIRLIAVDTTTGCSDTLDNLVQIELIDIWADVDTTFGCTPVTANFSGGSNYATTWIWNFGDGAASNQLNTSHTYNRPGNFRPRLSVWNSIGCRLDSSLRVSSYRPIVRFTVPDTNDCEPYTPTFLNSTTSLLPVNSWQWSLGNNTSSFNQVPNPTYNQGHYDIKLVVIDSLGCRDSLTRNSYIYVTNPIASFIADDTVSCVGRPLPFRSTSSGQSALALNWDFGDMNTSNQSFVSHTYTSNGTYNLSLTVTDSIGCQKTAQQNIIISDPDIDIDASTTFSTCPPLSVNFQGTTTTPHRYVSWEWDFGDGNSAVSRNPTNLYTQAGVYTVTLKATTITGCVDSISITNYITVNGPKGSFSYTPQTGCPGTLVTFSVQDSNTVGSVCDFGDGGLLTGSPKLTNFSYNYNTTGVFRPLVILDDGAGCRVPVVSPDSVVIFPLPSVNFSASSTSICDTGTVQFQDLTTSLATVTNWLWKFGDGQTSTLQSPSHFYAQPDTYQVTLVVTTVDGCVDSLVQPAFIISRPLPEVGIALSDTAGCAPFNLVASDISPNTNATITNWQSLSGFAGGTASTSTAQFNYPVPGRFQVRLQLTDQYGCRNEADTIVRSLALPDVDFRVLPDSFGCAPAQLQFQDRSSPGVAWRWNFGDGTTSPLQSPAHTYQNDGIYSVQLVVTDNRGCVDSLRKPAYIRLAHPQADFTFSPDQGCPPLEVSFIDITQTDTSLSNWVWSFGDNNSSTSANPMHTYAQAGIYTVSLVVTDAFGCKDSITKENIIEVLEDLQPNPPQLERVTVESNSSIRIEWERFGNPNNDFDRYELYREDQNGIFQLVYATNNLNQTFYIDNGINTPSQPYCYKIAVVNYCENVSDLNLSETHCSIQLRTTSLPEQIQLDWTPYVLSLIHISEPTRPY